MNVGRPESPATGIIRSARNFIWDNTYDFAGATENFHWPELDEFNFATDWFDVVAGIHPDRPAVKIVNKDLTFNEWSYGTLSARSDQVANWLMGLGIRRGDRVIVMLHNTIELWEVLFALLKVGAVAIPTSTLLAPLEVASRMKRVQAAYVFAPEDLTSKFVLAVNGTKKIQIGGQTKTGWLSYSGADYAATKFVPEVPTKIDEPSLLYFTSGTTAMPKLVEHTHYSYPVGHLSTLWWLGIREGDVHLNISSPGWGKHAWSNFFTPFLAQATVLIFNYDRFDANTLLDMMGEHHVSTFCAPPTVWRMLILADLGRLKTPPREILGAGEALNPNVINAVRDAWNNTIRDGYGQTEMTCVIGNSPGQPVKIGSMGRPMPGYSVVLLDADSGDLIEGEGEGEICLDLSHRNGGLMLGYYKDQQVTDEACRGGYYHTGDIGFRDDEGYITYVGRSDDVFKASDYKISPFELESALMAHDAVAEVAVVPSPDPVRTAVPKAFIVLVPGATAAAETAQSIFAHAKQTLAGYQLVRIVEFVEALPKTVSAKIRRVELRVQERERVANNDQAGQYHYADFRKQIANGK